MEWNDIRFDLVYGGQRMMFVNDTPSSIVLTEPHGEAELEVSLLAIALDIDAGRLPLRKPHRPRL